jgi:hypothetical protein
MKIPNLTNIKSNNGKIFKFKDVIESIENHKVIRFSNNALLTQLKRVANNTVNAINSAPRFKGRPNEFGNLVQWYFARECVKERLDYSTPTNSKGQEKESGYPDGFINYTDCPCYIEVKTYEETKKNQTLRSFFYSPSETSKITKDACHILVGFSTKNLKLSGFHFTDMFVKNVKLKLEFNQNNKEMYKDSELL